MLALVKKTSENKTRRAVIAIKDASVFHSDILC
jgi:hypothetical protein